MVSQAALRFRFRSLWRGGRVSGSTSVISPPPEDQVICVQAKNILKAPNSVIEASSGIATPKMTHHLKFIARTVMVQNGNVDAAYRTLNRILTMDGIIEDAKRRRYYEKPCRKRQRETYETCRRIYNAEMARKIGFLMRKNRPDPWLGC